MMVSASFFIFPIILYLPCNDARMKKQFRTGISCGGTSKIHQLHERPQNMPECGMDSTYDALEFKRDGISGSWSSFGSWSGSCDACQSKVTVRTRTRTCLGSGTKPFCPGRNQESEPCPKSIFPDCMENGTDYSDADIKNIPTECPQQCQLECQKHNECLFYTWDKKGKKCWLKSAKFRTSSYSRAISGPKVCHGNCFQYNMNTLGTILAEKSFRTPEQCQKDCFDNRMACSHFVYYTRGHQDGNHHELCRQFKDVTPNSTFNEDDCIFGPNHCK